MLDRAAILVAEDEPFIALDLVFAIEDAGGEVVGPASSSGEALALLGAHAVSAAILDFNLMDGDTWPVVEYLMERGVPLVLQSGVSLPPPLAARFPDLLVRIKPVRPKALIADLAALMRAG